MPDCYVEQQSYCISRYAFYLYIFLKKYSTFSWYRFVVLSCILQSSVFGTKPCYIEIHVSYDFLLADNNIIKLTILAN